VVVFWLLGVVVFWCVVFLVGCCNLAVEIISTSRKDDETSLILTNLYTYFPKNLSFFAPFVLFAVHSTSSVKNPGTTGFDLRQSDHGKNAGHYE